MTSSRDVLMGVCVALSLGVILLRCVVGGAQSRAAERAPALKDVYKDDFLIGVALPYAVAAGKDEPEE